MTESTITKERLKSVLETLLFLSEKPIAPGRLHEIIPEATEAEIREALQEMARERLTESSGLDLVEVAHGYQLRTRSGNSPWVFRLNKGKAVRLSRAALEALSIIAYKQPVTRAEIDNIRGVDSGPVLRTLLEKNLLRILGKREEPGSPLIYGTTKEFLEFFGLRDLSDLPSLREYSELGEASLAKLEKLLPRSGATAEAEQAGPAEDGDKSEIEPPAA